VLRRSGERRAEFTFQDRSRRGCRAAPSYHTEGRRNFERYKEWRQHKDEGALPRLVLTQKAGPFELSVKRRINSDGNVVQYLAAGNWQSYVTGLYRAADLDAGYSRHAGRRTFTSLLNGPSALA
jgi:hypothetical protein